MFGLFIGKHKDISGYILKQIRRSMTGFSEVSHFQEHKSVRKYVCVVGMVLNLCCFPTYLDSDKIQHSCS